MWRSRLRRAILLNDVLLVKRIIANNPKVLRNPDFADKGNTSLHLAASNGFSEIAERLIRAGHEDAEISRNADHETPLMLAARNGHVEVGKLLVDCFAKCILYTNKTGLDALALAAQNSNSTSLIPILLQNEEFPASPHVRDVDGNTPLHHASASGSLKALRVLLSADANPLAKNHYDWTPLAYSQTVAAEVYFKNLVGELEKKKLEGVRQGEEKERQRAAGVRLVGEDDGETSNTPVDEEEKINDALQRHWSPVERRRPNTPGSAGKLHEWDGRSLVHMRTRSGSGD